MTGTQVERCQTEPIVPARRGAGHQFAGQPRISHDGRFWFEDEVDIFWWLTAIRPEGPNVRFVRIIIQCN